MTTLPRTVPADPATDVSADLAALRAELAATRAELAELRTVVEQAWYSPRFAAVYPEFEDRFRGSSDEVRQRLSVYLPEVGAAVDPSAPGPRVLDVGPGRGEWLDLLARAGIAAIGVDENAAMIAQLRARGLDVVLADAHVYLTDTAAATFDVLTAFHVVEHLDLEALLGLLAHAARVLRPGGLLVLETPNPANLVMAACNFHLDPTHRAPVPPAQLEFLARTCGFTDVATWELHPKEDVDLSRLHLTGVDPAQTAVLAAALQKGLFGPQDYALLLRTPA